MGRRSLWMLAAVGAATGMLGGCGGGGGSTEPGPTDAEVAAVQDELAGQLDYYDQLAALAAMGDTASAIETMVSVIAADPAVLSARNALTGVAFTWASGRPGFVVIDPRGWGPPPAGSAPDVRRRPLSPPGGTRLQETPVVPKGRKAIYLAPSYSEFSLWDDSLVRTADSSLVKAGYERFTVYRDEQCTLDVIRDLDRTDLGVLRMSSHGVPWPSPEDVQDVYFITGEVPTEASLRANWKAVNEDYTILVGSYAGENRYFVDAAFFTANNDFGDLKPFISLGFCFGNLGGWPEALMTTSKAGATLGWDWAIYSHQDAPRIERFFGGMCDTSLAVPKTMGTWFAGESTVYHDYQDGRDVHMAYHGSADFALYAPLRITGIDPATGEPGDLVTLTGVGFGATKGKVRFGSVCATSIPQWTDTQIIVVAPQGLAEGSHDVRVEVGDLVSNTVRFAVAGDLMAKLAVTEWLEMEFVAAHYLQSGGPQEYLFEASLSGVRWDGATFSGADSTVNGTDVYAWSFSGRVDDKGRSLTLSWTKEWRSSGFDGSRQMTRSHAEVSGLPYVRDYGSAGYENVEYAPPTSPAGYVSGLEYTSTSWNAAGAVTSTDAYVLTNWGEMGDAEKLVITLTGSGD